MKRRCLEINAVEGGVNNVKTQAGQLALAVDVGGTKMLAAVIDRSGKVLFRLKSPTPRGVSARKTVEAIAELMKRTLAEAGNVRVAGAAVAVPGVVDPDAGSVKVTPNMKLSGISLGPQLSKALRIPVHIGNDANFGTLGVLWREAPASARSLIGVFVGTGIGGGIVVDGRLVRGGREVAGEIGHMIVEPGGPLCGCGNRGCLEALASRTAIERQIREAVKAGKKTVLTKLIDNKLKVIKSGKLKQALKRRDPLVTRILRDAARELGRACMTLQHVLDPDLIVLAGGVVESCGKFMLPVIREEIAKDTLVANHPERRVAISGLGDDAVIFGAACVVFDSAGSRGSAPRNLPYLGAGRVELKGKSFNADVFVEYKTVRGKKRSRK